MPDEDQGPGWLRLEGVTKAFDGVKALRGVELDIQRGDFFCLLGPSGCGKSTLLRIIAGLEHPDSGEVWLRGKALKREPPETRSVGMVFQSYVLFPHLSVFDNVAFPLRAGMWRGRRRRPASLVSQVEEALRLVRLEGFGDRMPRQLSGGQEQRVALARALVRHPDVVLLDEPLSALDLKVRQSMREELKQIQHAVGTTFVFVTHDQEEALIMATRIALMNDGRVEQVGTPTELYREPDTRFVTLFVGDQSSVAAVLESRNSGRVRVRWRDNTFLALDRCSAEPGEVVEVILRPEDVRAYWEVPDAPRAVVQSVSFRGAMVDLMVDMGDELLRTRCDARDFAGAKEGDEVSIRIEGEAGVAFDQTW